LVEPVETTHAAIWTRERPERPDTRPERRCGSGSHQRLVDGSRFGPEPLPVL